MMYYKMIGDRMVFSDCKTIQMPEGTWVSNPSVEQIHEAGWIEYVPPVIPPQPKTEPEMGEIMAAVKKMLSTSAEELSDEDALAVAALFPTWASKVGEQVASGERLWYNEKLFRVIQPHTVQLDWTPEKATSLFVEVSIVEWPEWVQPTGAHDAYNTGDKVTHNSAHWVSTIDNNVYEPGVYGWEERQ